MSMLRLRWISDAITCLRPSTVRISRTARLNWFEPAVAWSMPTWSARPQAPWLRASTVMLPPAGEPPACRRSCAATGLPEATLTAVEEVLLERVARLALLVEPAELPLEVGHPGDPDRLLHRAAREEVDER